MQPLYLSVWLNPQLDMTSSLYIDDTCYMITCRPDSTGLTKHLGNSTFLWLYFYNLDQNFGVSGTIDHAPPATLMLTYNIQLGYNNNYKFLTTQRLSSLNHMLKIQSHYICPFTSHHHADLLLYLFILILPCLRFLYSLVIC